MRVAVIGAGMSGLGAARTLIQGGFEVRVFEASDRVGGRVRTERLGDFVFDCGATSVAPRGKLLERVMLEDLDTTGLLKIAHPIYAHSSLRVVPGDPSKMRIDRYTYESGCDRLPILLAREIEVRTETKVEQALRTATGFEVEGDPFDAVILAVAMPDAEPLLRSLRDRRDVSFVDYRPCLSIMLGVGATLPTLPYHALVEPDQRHPLTWLSVESQKSPARAPEGATAFVAQMSPEYSRQKFEADESAIIGDALDYLNRLYAKTWHAVEVAQVCRWQNSQPESLAMFDNLNSPGDRCLICGDGTWGGRTELAYESGVLAARLLLENQ